MRVPYGGVSGGEEDGERRREVNVLVAEGDEDTPTCTTDLSV